MKQEEKLNRAVLNVTESIKDIVFQNIMQLSKKLSLTELQQRELLTVVKLSIEQGYHNSSKSFNATVKEVLSPAKK
jgi:hypothetical protein